MRLYFHKKPGEARGRIYLASENASGNQNNTGSLTDYAQATFYTLTYAH